jgi:hypothetical protein
MLALLWIVGTRPFELNTMWLSRLLKVPAMENPWETRKGLLRERNLAERAAVRLERLRT